MIVGIFRVIPARDSRGDVDCMADYVLSLVHFSKGCMLEGWGDCWLRCVA